MRIFLFLFIFFTNSVISQNYVLEYKITDIKKASDFTCLNKEEQNLYEDILREIHNYKNKIKVIMFCNQTEKYLRIEPGLDSDFNNKSKKSFAILMMGIYENIYSDGRFTYYYNNDDLFVTKFDNSRINWSISKDVDTIKNRKLLKAKSNKLEEYKFVNKDMVFYFDPNVSLNSGPYVFGNLPGLIVKLENINLTFELVKIEQTKIEIPTLSEFTNEKPIKTFEVARSYHKKVSNSILSKF